MYLDEKQPGEAQTKADPLSLESFIAWGEKQNPKTCYSYVDSRHCVIAQWLKGIGIAKYNLSVSEIDELFDGRGLIVAQGDDHAARTIGDAVARARKLACD